MRHDISGGTSTNASIPCQIRYNIVPLRGSDNSLRSERVLRVNPHALALGAAHIDLK